MAPQVLGRFLSWVLLLLAVHPATGFAQETVTVTPGAQYAAGGLYRFLFGSDYRDLWTTPVEVEVLDLAAFDGGLTPVKRGGGMQTRSLRFRSERGREFNFRSVNKHPIVPEELEDTEAEEVVQDQTSAGFPTAPLVVHHLLSAAGIIHSTPRLFVMPDSPRLGEFRSEFAGMLGILEEHPNEGAPLTTPGLERAGKVISTEELLDKLEDDPAEHLDTLAFLKARFFDLLIGDWDRHAGQWRWARIGPDKPTTAWTPVPEDRDQAFVRFDGVLLGAARSVAPKLLAFSPAYAGFTGATWNGRHLDRRLLPGVDRASWDSVAADLVRRLSDPVIDSAVRQLPPAHYRLRGAWLASVLKKRRDKLTEVADDFYEYLATEPEIHATDQADRVTATRMGPGGELQLRIEADAEDGDCRVVQLVRVFHPGETREVRVILHGSDDTVRVVGEGRADIFLRVVGGKGADVVLDSSRSGGIRVYDEDDIRVESPNGIGVNRRAYHPPETDDSLPYRDWGGGGHPVFWFNVSSDYGIFLGGGYAWTRYGFRKFPYASRQVMRVGYATTPQTYRAEYRAEWRREYKTGWYTLDASASGLETLRFYGFGNNTGSAGGSDFYKVGLQQFMLEPSLTVQVHDALRFTVGPRVQYNVEGENAGKFIRTIPGLYGRGNFGEIGLRGTLTLDTRDVPAAASRGYQLVLDGVVYPPVWDVQSTFGRIAGHVSTYLTAPIPFHPTLALRAGGSQVFGSYPWFEAAYLGGRRSLRGWREGRFAGDASLYGSSELRLRLGRVTIGVPVDIGVYGLVDAGRVFLDGEESDEWHTGFGGGLALSILNPGTTFTATAVRGGDRTAIYVKAGYHF